MGLRLAGRRIGVVPPIPLPREAEDVPSWDGEVARRTVFCFGLDVDGCASPSMYSKIDHDAGRDGMLQEDGGELPHQLPQSSMLREKCRPGFRGCYSSASACCVSGLHSRYLGRA
jgi:hypothetical protein